MGCEPDRSYKSRIDMLKIAQTRSQICFYWFVHLCFDTFIEATKPRELGHRRLGGKKECFSDRPNTEHDKSAHNYLQKIIRKWWGESVSEFTSIYTWWLRHPVKHEQFIVHMNVMEIARTVDPFISNPRIGSREESHVSYRVLNTPFLWCHRCGFIFYETMVHGVWY
jgi:hypothetical protein